MTRQLLIIIALTTLLSCSDNQHDKTSDVIIEHYESGPTKLEKQFSDTAVIGFKSAVDIVYDKHSYAWVNLNRDTASCSIHFNLGKNDTMVCIEYTPECWLMFPFMFSNNKISLFWDCTIDSKYDFDFVKAITRIDKKHDGKIFVVLELINDTTLKATYPIPEIIRKLNSADKERVLFPKCFFVNKDFV